MAESADNTTNASSKGGGSKLVPILLLLNLILVAAVLAAFLLRGGDGAVAQEGDGGAQAHGAKDKKEEAPGPTARLADFVVHLRDPEADRYARISFEIEVATEEDKAKFAGFMPRVRDDFIAYLSDRTLEELRGSEQIGRTKSALSEKLVALAPGVKIRALYITDLVIQ